MKNEYTSRAMLAPTEVSLKTDITNVLNQSENLTNEELIEALRSLL